MKCQNRAKLLSEEGTTSFSVDVTTPLKILKVTTPPAINQTGVEVGLVTNKRAACVFSIAASPDTVLSTLDGFTHSRKVDITADGMHEVNYTCSFAGEGAESAPETVGITKQLVVDTTPPDVPEVDVDGNLSLDGLYKVSYKRTILKATWNATDPGNYYASPFAPTYLYRVIDSTTGEVMRNYTTSHKVNQPEAITGLNLTVGERYYVEATSVDMAGNTQPEPGRSIDVLIDVASLPAHCTDGALSGDETEIDCGGSCEPCTQIGVTCQENSDCASGLCSLGTCAESSCTNGIQDSDESGVDCGGSCERCALGNTCFGNSDCASNSCDPVQSVCIQNANSCQNGEPDIGEAGVDCGGSCPNACDIGSSCELDGDCQSKYCKQYVCAESSCEDGALNGQETDVDCGGPCAKCPVGNACAGNDDCFQVDCISGYCGGVQDSRSQDVDENLKAIDSDGDGLSDYDEVHGTYGFITDPNLADSDGDGFSDFEEINAGSDPTDFDSVPGGSGFSWLLLFIALAVIISGVAYYGYTQYYMPPKNLALPRKTHDPISASREKTKRSCEA